MAPHARLKKWSTDGALGSRTAAMLAPYSDDPKNIRNPNDGAEKLKALASERDKAGFNPTSTPS